MPIPIAIESVKSMSSPAQVETRQSTRTSTAGENHGGLEQDEEDMSDSGDNFISLNPKQEGEMEDGDLVLGDDQFEATENWSAQVNFI